MRFLRKWLREPGGEIKACESPIFIFAASWRTGSTLLRRIVNASGEVFIWGEPAFLSDVRALHDRWASHLMKIEGNRKGAFGAKVGGWHPIVSPAPGRTKDAFTAFFAVLYGSETFSMGKTRWGFKEVRPDAVANMHFLRELYPGARFLFLVRDPWDTYQSVRGKKFHAQFKSPLQPVQGWNSNVTEFLDDPGIRGDCLLVRYEELIAASRSNSGLLAQIASHLGLTVTDKMFQELETKTDPSGAAVRLSGEEVAAVRDIAGAAAARLGYALR